MTLLEKLEDARTWLPVVDGRRHVTLQLTRVELDQLIAALAPRRLDPMNPPGTRRSQEEIAELRKVRYQD